MVDEFKDPKVWSQYEPLFVFTEEELREYLSAIAVFLDIFKDILPKRSA